RVCHIPPYSIIDVASVNTTVLPNLNHLDLWGKPPHDHTLGLPPNARDCTDLRAQHHPTGADHQHLFLRITDHSQRCELAHPVGDFEREHPLSRPMFDWVLGQRRALAVAALCDDKKIATLDDGGHAGDRVAFAELDPDHALRVAAHGADLGLAEPDRLAELGGDDHLVRAARRRDPVELVALLQVDRDQAVAAHVRVL